MEENKNVVEQVEEIVRKQGELVSYRTSAKTDEIDKALLEFNKEIESIEKGEQNPFYHNYYCSLDQIIAYIRPILAKHNLYVQQFPIYGGENMLSVKTIIKHTSGQFIESDSMPIKYGKSAQDFGGTNTYLKRYTLSSILGLSFEQDDDGNANKVAMEKSKPKAESKSETPTSEDAPSPRRRR